MFRAFHRHPLNLGWVKRSINGTTLFIKRIEEAIAAEEVVHICTTTVKMPAPIEKNIRPSLVTGVLDQSVTKKKAQSSTLLLKISTAGSHPTKRELQATADI